MGETPLASPAGRGLVRRALRWVRERPLRQLAGGAAAAGLALTAPFGGLDDVKAPALATAEPGQVVHTGPIDLTITRASSTTRPGERFTAADDGQYILVFGTARATTTVTLEGGELADAVRLRGVGGLEKFALGPPVAAEESETAGPTPYVVDDSTLMTTVTPGITYEVAWVWRQHDTGAPSSVEVMVQGFTFRQSSLQDVEAWLDPTPITHLRLPVAQKPAWTAPDAAGSSS